MVIPLTIILGISTISSLIVTMGLGVLMHRGRAVFKYHRGFAYLTVVLAVVHAGLVVKGYYFS